MSTKKEIYYKFIFPNYDSLSGSDSDSFPTDDGVDQTGEVRALCRKCPERVITYDQLTATNTKPMYTNGTNGWSADKKNTIKNYIDEYLKIPKYFNLRNYWDTYKCQEGGMSLMVSGSPEIGGEYSHYTKFKVGDKVVYCAVMISSGDFFYNFCLPEEVIEKSALRDEIVRSRFHSNWYFNNNERVTYNNTHYGIVKKLSTDYPKQYHVSGNNRVEYTEEEYINAGYPEGRGYTSAMNPHFGQEKRIFVQHYFAYPGFNYIYQGTAKSYINFRDSSGNVYKSSDVYYRDRNGVIYNQINYFDQSGAVIPDISNVNYITETVINANNSQIICDVQTIPTDGTCGYFLISDNTELTRYKYSYQKNLVHSRKVGNTTHYFIKLASPLPTGETELDVDLYFNVEEYKELDEDLKRDFIDLEITRRILYYNNEYPSKLKYNGNSVDIIPTGDIPIINNPVGINYNNGPSQDLLEFMSKVKGDPTYLAPLHPNDSGTNTKLSYEPPEVYNASTGVPPLQIPYNLLRYTLNDRPPFTDCETVLVMWVANSDPLAKDSNGTTDVIPDGDIAGLHNLNWQQYAIPISCRCCFKNPDDRDHGSRHIHNRFLIDYPKKWDYYYTYNGNHDNPANDVFNISATKINYRFHTRRAEAYDSNSIDDGTKFKEILYLQDLIRYSNDYIIAYQNSDAFYYNKGFDIQGYLFKNYSSDFAKLYVSKTFVSPSLNDGHIESGATGVSMNQQGQFYYIRVNKTDRQGNNVFDINTNGYSSSNRRICICKPNTVDAFKPSDKIYRLNINNEKWIYNASNFIKPTTKVSILGEEKDFGFDDISYHQTYGYNDWFIYDSYLIALFKKPNNINTLTKRLTLTDHISLYNDLGKWENIYISSLGVTQYNPVLVDATFFGGSQTTIYPLGILDNHIKLDDVAYGSTTNNKIVIGFANMLDYLQEDLYHFKFINNEYKPVKTELLNHSSSSPGPIDSVIEDGFTCTAYVMSYIP